jgi:hypothetical protein
VLRLHSESESRDNWEHGYRSQLKGGFRSHDSINRQSNLIRDMEVTAKRPTSLTELIGVPERVTEIPPARIPPLLIELAAQQAALAALQNALAARLLAGSQNKWEQPQPPEEDQLMTVAEAAKEARHEQALRLRAGPAGAVPCHPAGAPRANTDRRSTRMGHATSKGL